MRLENLSIWLRCRQSLRLGENSCYAISSDWLPLWSPRMVYAWTILYLLSLSSNYTSLSWQRSGVRSCSSLEITSKNLLAVFYSLVFFFTNVINVFNVIDDSYLFAIIVNSFYCSVLSEQIKELNKQVDQLEVYLWWVDGTKVCYIQMITFSLLKTSPSWK